MKLSLMIVLILLEIFFLIFLYIFFGFVIFYIFFFCLIFQLFDNWRLFVCFVWYYFSYYQLYDSNVNIMHFFKFDQNRISFSFWISKCDINFWLEWVIYKIRLTNSQEMTNKTKISIYIVFFRNIWIWFITDIFLIKYLNI
jgi:hypothetical protein